MVKYELLEVFSSKDKASRNARFYRREGYLVTIRKGSYGFIGNKVLTHGLYIGGFRKN